MFGTAFIVITVIVMGFTGYMTGQAMANTWRSFRQLVIYCLMLGLADRFLTFALYGGELLSITGYLVDTTFLTVIAALSFRFNLAGKMASQYPWLFERTGPFSWRDRVPDDHSS